MSDDEVTSIDAIQKALSDAGVEVITYVPGYPVTELVASLGDMAEISVNEKVALEIVLGASATGRRGMVVVKQLGMNLLADPLSISATHTIGSGVVVLVGDDIGPGGSQTEMDSRYYGALFELPVLDPADPAKLYNAIVEAYLLSERISAPVIVRITNKLMALSFKGRIESCLPKWAEGMSPSRKTFDRSIWDLTSHGRHQRYHRDGLPLAEDASEKTALNIMRICGDIGIIASGRTGNLAADLGTSLLLLGYAYPLPWTLIRHFISEHRRILVAEEIEPFIESQLRLSEKVCGRLTGHLPFGEILANDLERALENIDEIMEQRYSLQTAKEAKSKTICDDCPNISIYDVIKKIDVPVAGDAGCSFRAVRPPVDAVDVTFGLGSAIGAASGFDKKGIAIIGDFAFAHSGLQGLINAKQQGRSLLVIFLLNRLAAMSGGQAVPDCSYLLEAIVPDAKRIELPAEIKTVEETVRAELEMPGITALIVSAGCPRYL